MFDFDLTILVFYAGIDSIRCYSDAYIYPIGKLGICN